MRTKRKSFLGGALAVAATMWGCALAPMQPTVVLGAQRLHPVPSVWLQGQRVPVAYARGIGRAQPRCMRCGGALSVGVLRPWLVRTLQGTSARGTERGLTGTAVHDLFGPPDEISAPDTSLGTHFGQSVALSADGRLALIGAAEPPTSTQGTANPSGPRIGVGYVFVRGPGGWSQQAELIPSGRRSGDWGGALVALSGDGRTALISAAGETGSQGARFVGAVYVFARGATGWSQQARLAPPATDEKPGAQFGSALALNGHGTVAFVGAPNDAGGGSINSRMALQAGNYAWEAADLAIIECPDARAHDAESDRSRMQVSTTSALGHVGAWLF